MNILSILDYIGVFVFAMSGILTASNKKLDLFGGFIIAFVTALGGGTLRDLLLNVEIGWIIETKYIYIVLAGAFFALLFKKVTQKMSKTIFLFDTIGIGLFTILGVQKALLLNAPVEVAVMFGVMTATFGGVIRDILCTEIPLIFRKEIYATACFVGAITYVSLNYFGVNDIINTIISGAIIISIRTVAVIKKLSLPLINEKY
ncbi:trimeric intracellular cation channel family protein [Vicingus serpentipes]|uniref:Trimeric intracellular cation channel family protein n=1 Tax=Vicingus serpentipes TaxID=1926625 RepID=A0A5C6RWE5_9FLAO|nr:trimeric intracellular cation channel family protein [Vicingus serpentipes]TXB66648.1 trimeric intracellular cation channel family protein [Vicingus serpentipes]